MPCELDNTNDDAINSYQSRVSPELYNLFMEIYKLQMHMSEYGYDSIEFINCCEKIQTAKRLCASEHNRIAIMPFSNALNIIESMLKI